MAEWKPVALIMPPNESVDEVQLSDEMATVVDGIPLIVNQRLQIKKRPGLDEFADLGTGLPVDGLYWWDKQQVVIAVSGGRVWKILDLTGTRIEITGSSELQPSAIVSFAQADNSNKLVMANGGRMVHTDLSALTAMADPDAPTLVTHVAELDGYLLANEVGSGRIRFSSFEDFSDWNALDLVTAEAKPDDVLAMGEAFREIITVGRESVEFFYNDGQTPFARVQGSAQPYGIEAVRSLTQAGGSWIWLSHTRRLVTMQGRQVMEVSTPYDRLIQEFPAVNDAVGYSVSVSGYPLYVLNFPTARTTLCFNVQNQTWHKWGYWDSQRARYERFRGNTYCYARSWNVHLVGDYENGLIYTMDREHYTDNGNPIRTLLRSGHTDHGVRWTKRSSTFRLHTKRGVGNADCPDPQVMYRRRVNNRAQWGNERWKPLGKSGQHEPYIDWHRNGIFQSCQHEIVHSDPTDFVVMGAEEYIEPLGR
jgi:hypothetical protein